MKINWNKLIVNLTVWLVAEITLNAMGLDTLADYGEFLFGKHQTIEVTYTVTIQ